MAHLFQGITALFGGSSHPSSSTPNRNRGGYSYGGGYEGGTTGYGRGGGNVHHHSPSASPHVEDRYQSAYQEHDEATEREDLLDQHVAYYLKHHPEVHARHTLSRLRPGVYNFDGREISVEWHYSDEPDQPGFLIAIDGPLRQPFADYMQDNENGVEWDDKRLGKSSLSQIPKGKRLSFGDGNKVYSRLEAMKVAKEQALVREKAADFVKDGAMVPQHELMAKYKKTISQKLGERRQRQSEAEQPVTGPPPPAEAPAPVAPPQAAAASPAPASEQKRTSQTHGAPKYCLNHDKTEKRKKTKPQNLECAMCKQVIQTNYVEFYLCPGCSEKNHLCMCCGAPAVGAPPAAPAPPPQAQHQAPSPMAQRGSPQNRVVEQSPVAQQQPVSKPGAGMSPMNLFGMPDLLGGGQDMNAPSGPPALRPAQMGAPQMAAQQGARPGTIMMPQNNQYASARAPQQNAFSSQNAFQSYKPTMNPMASQNVIIRR